MRQEIFEIITSDDRSFRTVERSARMAKAVINAQLLVDEEIISCAQIHEGEKISAKYFRDSLR